MIGLAWLLAACASGEIETDDPKDDGDTDDPTDDTDTTTGDDTGEPWDTVPGESPEVTAVNAALCEPNVDDVDTWTVQVSVDDPQGAGSIAPVGSTVTVLADGEALATFDLACGGGQCSVTWTENDDGDIDCDVGAESVFRFRIVDEDGNSSAPYDYQPE
ncbi:MAG: hypothetical protein ACOZNI_31650 [Myxococcota bacterium]